MHHNDLPGESVLLRISVTFMMKVYTHAVLKHDDTGLNLSESRNAQNEFIVIFLDVEKERIV